MDQDKKEKPSKEVFTYMFNSRKYPDGMDDGPKLDYSPRAGIAYMGEIRIGHNPEIPLKDQKVIDEMAMQENGGYMDELKKSDNAGELDFEKLDKELGITVSEKPKDNIGDEAFVEPPVEVQTSGDMALSLLKNIIAELGPNKGVEFLLDMSTTLISNIQANIATNGFTEIADTEAIKDMTAFCARDIDFKLNDILENATYTFTKETDKKIWEDVQAKKKKYQEELEEQRKINALLNSPVVPMKDGFTPPAPNFGEDGMEKLDPQVISILNARKRNG